MGKQAARPNLAAVLLTTLAVALTAFFVVVGSTHAAGGNSFTVHNLVSDGGVPADHVDPNLVNGWGLARSATSPWWVADNGTDVSTLYRADGTPQALVVSVPNAPTGAVANGGTSFVVGSGPAFFLF